MHSTSTGASLDICSLLINRSISSLPTWKLEINCFLRSCFNSKEGDSSCHTSLDIPFPHWE